jgi:NDP-sugar pyrophosphorylase family protein
VGNRNSRGFEDIHKEFYIEYISEQELLIVIRYNRKDEEKMNIVIPMAGLGNRFAKEGFDLPKPLISVNGKTLLEHSVETLGIEGNYIFVTREFENSEHNEILTRLIQRIKPGSVEIKLDFITKGSVETCLKAADLINNDDELIITNCDQRLEWEHELFLDFCRNQEIDGAVLTYKSTNPKNSFAKIENDLVVKLAEKNPISDDALVGLHYWKKGSDFVRSGSYLLDEFTKTDTPECYISESYNYLISEGKKIKKFDTESNQYISLGTPYDLSIYLAKIKEFQMEKPKTIFCDIDGTILKHVHKFSDVCFQIPELLEGVRKKIDQWDSHGHKIVFCTARKESARELTEKQLRDLGLCWDYLIMGISSGTRVLINDKLKKTDPDRAISANVVTNRGFDSIDWETYGL